VVKVWTAGLLKNGSSGPSVAARTRPSRMISSRGSRLQPLAGFGGGAPPGLGGAGARVFVSVIPLLGSLSIPRVLQGGARQETRPLASNLKGKPGPRDAKPARRPLHTKGAPNALQDPCRRSRSSHAGGHPRLAIASGGGRPDPRGIQRGRLSGLRPGVPGPARLSEPASGSDAPERLAFRQGQGVRHSVHRLRPGHRGHSVPRAEVPSLLQRDPPR
jgi:hypothetical protein